MATVYDADEVLVGGATDVYVSDIGTAFPTTLVAELPGWHHLGYTTEDGVKPNLSRGMNEIKASQSFWAIRRMVADLTMQIEFSLLQWNSQTVLLALGGGAITEPTNNVFRYDPPAASFVDERQLLLHTVDGTKTYRWGFTRVQNTADFESSLTRTDGAFLPIGMTVLDPGTDAPFFFLTDDPAFVLAS